MLKRLRDSVRPGTKKNLDHSPKTKLDTTFKHKLGFSLLELLLAMAVLGILVSIAVPYYGKYINDSKAQKAMQEMRQIEIILQSFKLDVGRYPDSLAEINSQMIDPWDNPYQYRAIEGASPKMKGHQRKDHNLVPINSDFDLFSSGRGWKERTTAYCIKQP
ncbi:MAG: type II secretion system protein GspG [Candidatus Thiodiazotropha sp. (ex Lucinoma kastoroae)]|nr:type II secretion system protein GspG [Candidatus Thiodiazotropha sp. (ex Lucinoma kastoroae)]